VVIGTDCIGSCKCNYQIINPGILSNHGSQLHRGRKHKYPEKSTDLLQVNDKFDGIMGNRGSQF
jgi:hypothetical protein